MGVFDIMATLRDWERASGEEKTTIACVIAHVLHAGVSSGKVRMIDTDDPLFVEYLDGGWDATMTFYDFVKAKREKERAVREYAGNDNL